MRRKRNFAVLLLAISLIPLSASGSNFGKHPTSKDELSLHDKRSGRVCPNGKAFLEYHAISNDSANLYEDDFNETLVFRSTFHQFTIDRGRWTGINSREDQEGEGKLTPKRFAVNIELLVSKGINSYTKEQLGLILDRFQTAPSKSKTSYKLNSVTGRDDEKKFRLKNSYGNLLEVTGDSISYELVSKGKSIFADSTSRSHQLYCTENGELHIRKVSILNDKGDFPGKPLEQPTMVAIIDTFIPPDEYKKKADISF